MAVSVKNDGSGDNPLCDRTNAGVQSGVGARDDRGWESRVGEKRPQRDGEGEGEGDTGRAFGADNTEPPDDEMHSDEEILPLSVAELYHEDEDDVPRADDDDIQIARLMTSTDVPTCPVCQKPLMDVADTERARVKHVNDCLDGGGDDYPDYPNSFHSLVEIHERDDDEFENEIGENDLDKNKNKNGKWHDVAAWAHSVEQPQFAEAVVTFKMTWKELTYLTDDDLVEMGIEALGDRKRIAAAIKSSRRAIDENKAGDEGGVAEGTVAIDVPHEEATPRPRGAGWHPTRIACAVAPVFHRAKAGADLRDEAPVNLRAPPKARNAGGARPKPNAQGNPSPHKIPNPKPSRYTPRMDPQTPPPPWIRVPGTKFIVDGFAGYGKSHSGWCKHWFLTHFHADHYKGLTKSTPGPGCVIWCSRPTAQLCVTKLGIQKERLRVVDLNRKFKVENVSVTFVDANHCPGAVMVIFDDIPKGEGNNGSFNGASNGAPVLATGDMRFQTAMTACPLLQELSKKAPSVMLDTTYCDPKHTFPKQKEVLRNVRDAVLAENHNPKVLFLFGTYTIGKERVFFEAAKTLGKKLYVGKQKKKVLDALGDTLSSEDRSLITSDDTSTNLHVVPMGSVSFDRMGLIKKYYKNRYDTIIGFKPTGWTFVQTKKNARGTKRSKKGSLIQYQVPYSEHSSFSELREFVKFLKPTAILPHVGNDRGEKARRMVRLLTMNDEELEREQV